MGEYNSEQVPGGRRTKWRARAASFAGVLAFSFATAWPAVAKEQASAAAGKKALKPEVRLETRTHPEYGKYVADSEGRPLYIFERDEKGVSTCYSSCARAWPPLLTYGHPVKAGEGIDKDLVGLVTRINETTQVSYGGHALYYYYPDKKGQITGHDVRDHGAEWYLIAPSGEVIHDEKPASKKQSSSIQNGPEKKQRRESSAD